MSTIVITTWGSLGDLHPYLAIALELSRRGHQAVVATCPSYQHKVESLGLRFCPVRPDCQWLHDPDRVRWISHHRFGMLRVGQELMGSIEESYGDLLAAVQGADLLLSSQAAFAARLVAEKTGIPWVSALHIPLGFYSVYDPPVLGLAPTLSRSCQFMGPLFWRPAFWFAKRASRYVARPWYRLRQQLELPPAGEPNPMTDSHSPRLVLALFSSQLVNRQPDWPSGTVITGYPWYDGDQQALSPELAEFLDDGPPPIVFTLGSAVAGDPGQFFERSVACAAQLNRRAVLVAVTSDERSSLPPGMMAVEYAPDSQLVPRAAAIVHHGGIGTTGLAMQAGRPMLVVPHAWDQPDHAHRVCRLGIARSIPKSRYTAERAAAALTQLLDDPDYGRRAAQVKQALDQESGVETACDAVEDVLERP